MPFVMIKGTFEIPLRLIKNNRRHRLGRLLNRSTTSIAGFAPLFPATKFPSRLFTSASHAASIASRSTPSMLNNNSSAKRPPLRRPKLHCRTFDLLFRQCHTDSTIQSINPITHQLALYHFHLPPMKNLIRAN